MPRTKILLVEDEAIVSMDLHQRLEKLGYLVVAEAINGTDALEKAGALAPALVLMDIRLRGSDGIAAAREIQRLYNIPVIYLTAHSDEATLSRAKLTEPFGYLLKPVEDRELQIAIEIALYKHRMDSKVKQMERWLATTLSSIGDGVITTDLNGIVNYMNRMAEHLTEWSTGEAHGRELSEIFSIFRTKNREPVEISFQKVLEEGLIIGLAEDMVLMTRTGRELPVNDSIAPLRDEHDRINGMVIVFRDISAQLETRKSLHKSEERLRQVEKIEALGQLAGGVAHDFNNLMTVVTGYSSLLLNSRNHDDPDRLKIEQIKQAAEQASTLTRQLLAFSRKQVLNPRTLNMNEIIASQEKMLARLLGEDILFEISLAKTLDLVKVDQVQIGQVLLNLAANARDAMPRGGKLIFSTDTVELDERYVSAYPDIQAGTYVMLTVSDTGGGMDPATQTRVFEPFFTTKDLGKGTGLGLSTVYGIVKQSGGHITIESAPGQGTTFRIYLPVDMESQPEEEESAAPLVRGGSETILVVEDSDSVRELVVALLRQLGYTVLSAGTGAEAVSRFSTRNDAIDLLITDVVMPDTSGQQVAEQLAAIHPDLRILYMSGYAETAIASYGMLQPEAGFLSKPFTTAELARKVRDMLETA